MVYSRYARTWCRSIPEVRTSFVCINSSNVTHGVAAFLTASVSIAACAPAAAWLSVGSNVPDSCAIRVAFSAAFTRTRVGRVSVGAVQQPFEVCFVLIATVCFEFFNDCQNLLLHKHAKLSIVDTHQIRQTFSSLACSAKPNGGRHKLGQVLIKRCR